MKRYLMTLILSGFVGSMVLVGNAEACHKRKSCTCAPAPTCAVVQPAPCPAPAPVCEPVACAPRAKKCGGMFSCFKGMKLGCHKKSCGGCGPAPAPCETVAYAAPVTYSYSGTFTATYAAPQATAQH
jgi:hypothetical protein